MYILQGSKSLLSSWKTDPVKFGLDVFPEFFFDKPGAVHPALAYDMLNAKDLYTLIMITRDAAKTIYGGMLIPIHQMLFQNYQYIVIASLSNVKAQQTIHDIKTALTSERFVDAFGEFRPRDKAYAWSQNQAVGINYKTGGDSRRCLFHARSDESQIAGLRFINARPQLMVIDDVEDDKTVLSDDLIEKKLKWVTETVQYGLDPKRKKVFIIGTVYKHSSMLVRMSKFKKGVKVIKYPMLATGDVVDDLNKRVDVFNSHVDPMYQIDRIKAGESIWEARHPTAVILKEKEAAAANGTLAAWMRQRQLDISEDTVGTFAEEDIRIFDPRDIRGLKLNFYILVDMAYKKGKKNDETGIVAFGVDKDEKIFVFEAIKGKWGDRDFVNKFISVLSKYYVDPDLNIKFAGVESYAFGFINSLLKIGLAKAGFSIYVKELKPASRRKEDRIRAMIPYCEKWQIHIQKKHYALKEEMLRFHGEADQKGLNMLDAFAYYPDVATKATVKEKVGLGSAANRKAWESFTSDNGRVIGGMSGVRINSENNKQIEQSYY